MRKSLPLLGGLLALAWLVGLSRFVLSTGAASMTLPRLSPPPDDEHNLAGFRLGPTVRVSSYHRDPYVQHHPLFVVDQRVGPTLLEKWVSAAHDRQPWLEITWREPRALDRIVLRHAGEYEHASYTLDDYTLTCLRDGPGGGPSVSIVGNHASLAIHPLACTGARGVRLQARSLAPGAVVRLFELEAWGR